MQQWVISVNGAEVGHLECSQSVEIGRKPLRPLADDGMSRLEIPDDTRSMSKRHAVFSVSENGSASLRDLGSTNGTYVVREDGELMRLPENVEFLLPGSPARMQFGDVPVVFTRTESPAESESAPAVPDLFDYVVGEVHQEPDAADMSVDDILNLRAGEPTTMFRADRVRDRAHELDVAQYQAFRPAAMDEAVPLAISPETPEDEAPRDLFVDAQNVEEPEADDVEPQGRERAVTDSVWDLTDIRNETARDDDGQAEPAQDGEAVEEAGQMPAQALPDVQDPQPSADGEAARDSAPLVFTAMTATEPATEPAIEQTMEDGPEADESSEAEVSAEQSDEAYTPAFEPGSVFERVSQGGFAQAEQSVEVDGLTSDEAKRTGDFTVQFEMARHPQLLPFLAMNPSLYDDLYAWLAAQGNSDIDAALERNEGYQEYRKAVGK